MVINLHLKLALLPYGYLSGIFWIATLLFLLGRFLMVNNGEDEQAVDVYTRIVFIIWGLIFGSLTTYIKMG